MRTRGVPPAVPDEVSALRAIRESLDARGYPPSQREIAAVCGWSSVSQAHNLLRLMEAKGLVTVATRIPRGMQVTDAGLELIGAANMVAKTEAV